MLNFNQKIKNKLVQFVIIIVNFYNQHFIIILLWLEYCKWFILTWNAEFTSILVLTSSNTHWHKTHIKNKN